LGLVHLKYLDESGCCGHCPTGYGYAALLATKTHQAIATARAASQYLGSVEQASFEYALMLGSLSTETYLKLMEWQAQTAQRRLEETGKLT